MRYTASTTASSCCIYVLTLSERSSLPPID